MRIWQSSTKPNVLGNWYFYSIGETPVSIWSQPRPQSKFNLFFCFSLIATRCTGDEVDLFCSFRKTGKTNKLTKKVTENHFTISLSNAKHSYQSTTCHFCNWFGKWFGNMIWNVHSRKCSKPFEVVHKFAKIVSLAYFISLFVSYIDWSKPSMVKQ